MADALQQAARDDPRVARRVAESATRVVSHEGGPWSGALRWLTCPEPVEWAFDELRPHRLLGDLELVDQVPGGLDQLGGGVGDRGVVEAGPRTGGHDGHDQQLALGLEAL